jgi:enhancer of polycomb-like protein
MSRDEAIGLLRKEAYTHSSEENEFLKRKLYSKSQFDADKDAFLARVYEYWHAKRARYRHPLTPSVITDKSGVVTAPNNPYLVFRRRTEKMQTRKNRKNEEHSYENMLILKRDLIRAQ